MTIRALTWNLYHGRDFPPDPKLFTWRSRLLRISERNDTHVQVNRDLFDAFAATLAAASWDVALLQECPPRWAELLAAECEAAPHRTLTSRNSLGAVRAVAARLNPDLIGSDEGGSNLTLVRHRAGEIVDRRELVLRERQPERRTMAFTRIRLATTVGELCVGNLHASAGRANSLLAEREALIAAARSVEWTRSAPLILGGDFNLRPHESSIYEELERSLALRGAGAADSLDHLLVRGLEPTTPPKAWPPEEREVHEGSHAIRLSDHAPVSAAFTLPRQRGGTADSRSRADPAPRRRE